VAQTFLGKALLGQNNAPEAVSVLEQAVTGYHDTPPVMAFVESRQDYAAEATMALAEALAKTGNRERARNLVESVLTDLEAAVVGQPENWFGNEELASSLVLLAGMLDPANAADAARRQSLLDRATAILNSRESQGRLTVVDKEALPRIESLRGTAGAKDPPSPGYGGQGKTEIKQP
jgi:hypothetical protein